MIRLIIAAILRELPLFSSNMLYGLPFAFGCNVSWSLGLESRFRSSNFRVNKCATHSGNAVGPRMSHGAHGPSNTAGTSLKTTEETFAEDAGRDLFFTGMSPEMAIDILGRELGSLDSPDDRFIAAERLKFFPSIEATDALLSFVERFQSDEMDSYVLEDKVARRKCVETLGRYRGQFERNRVFSCLQRRLEDADEYMVEVAIWSLAELGLHGQFDTLQQIQRVLDNDAVSKRVVIQTLMRARHKPALEQIRKLANSSDGGTASAAMTAVCVLGDDPSGMDRVVSVLRSDDLNVRRSALEDITLSKYVPALPSVAVAPNSLVLRARTCRVLLEEKYNACQQLDLESAVLLDRLIWDHPCDLDLLGMTKETKKARDIARNVRQLYKNDAVYPYLASRTLAEDHRGSTDAAAGDAVLTSFVQQPYFDYFGAYHVFKTLGWLRHRPAIPLLLDNAENLPPRFFNHQLAAILALSELHALAVGPVIESVVKKTSIWELKYACLIAAERLRLNGGKIRTMLMGDDDWIIRLRARSAWSFDHLRSDFPRDTSV